MKTEEMAESLRTRAQALGLSVAEVAERAGCSEQAAAMVLEGDPSAPVGALVAVCEALGFVSVVVPRPLASAVMAGNEPTEPKVPTVVSEALRRLTGRRADAVSPQGTDVTSDRSLGRQAEPARVVLFLDLDGVVHAQGDSRIDERGAIAGAQMFRWWPQLAGVLEDYPNVGVVVHSSWRRFWPSVKFLAPLLPPALSARVVDVTDPDVVDRHRSIELYLEAHPDVGNSSANTVLAET